MHGTDGAGGGPGESEESVAERRLHAGVVLYDAGEYHAAHDPWEAHWLALADREDTPEDGTERRFFQGLVQTTAAVYHARRGNWTGATGLAAGALGYLDGLGETYRGVALAPVRQYLEALAADPEVVERGPPVRLTVAGRALDPADLPFDALVLAVEALVEEYALDGAMVERAVEFARADLDEGRATSPFVALLYDLVEGRNRGLVVRRLGEHVDRREHRESDVAGLFDVGGGGDEGEGESQREH
ncbi:DUF309 domain-containing protein [Halomarina litorea]|uniref:DUF309 domain-containing protein n=1 Tax=Halomarina litorea TaxID=2961595 RepID=UPI0020C21BFF|nr:DUF309 domain-containing protein [Halomarina sp. BCD28]